MRTIRQHEPEVIMLTDLKNLLLRSHGTIFEDALGVTSLFVLLFIGLTLSGSA